MSVAGLSRRIANNFNIKYVTKCLSRLSTSANPELQGEDEQKLEDKNIPPVKTSNSVPLEYRFLYPEFLPDPKLEWRNPIREKLERLDMLNRREHIEIPEFYVGTIMAVTRSNIHDATKSSRFLGICIQRRGCGLRARFTLRNVVDNLGTEIEFMMYDPTLQKIEVLRLEKRLDSELLYLRDALPEYSTFPADMEAETLPEGDPVPINPIKVKLRPRPWVGRWELREFQGIEESCFDEYLHPKEKKRAENFINRRYPRKFDLMMQYRKTIPEEEQKEIFTEVYSALHQMEITRKKLKKKRVIKSKKH